VVLGVGNRRILVREHTTKLTNPVHIRQSLPFEVQDRLPVPVDQAVLDFVPTAHDADGVHGLLVAAVSEHMEELVGALERAKLRATSVDLVAFGQVRALAGLAPAGRTALYVGIGEHTTHIVIATDGVPKFVRVVPIDIVAPPAEPADPAAAVLSTAVPAAAVPAAEPAFAASPLAGAASGDGMSASAVDGRFDQLVAGLQTAPVPEPVLASAPRPRTRAERRRARAAATPATVAEPAPMPRAVEEALHPDVQAALIDLVGRLRGTVTFYRDRPGALPIDMAFVSGAHAAHPRLLEAIGRVTDTPVHPVTALDLVRAAPQTAGMPQAVAGRMASTVSLLLGGAR
jgi:type IV pilus assembly protein PilM